MYPSSVLAGNNLVFEVGSLPHEVVGNLVKNAHQREVAILVSSYGTISKRDAVLEPKWNQHETATNEGVCVAPLPWKLELSQSLLVL